MTTPDSTAPADTDADATTEDDTELTDEQRREKLNRATVTLNWQGLTFRIPKRRGRWPVDAVRDFARDNYIEALVALIGEDGWARLKTKVQIGDDLEAFSDYAGARIRKECVP